MTRRPRSRAIANASSGRNMTRFQATMGKLQTTLRGPSDGTPDVACWSPRMRVRVNVVVHALEASFSDGFAEQTGKLPDAAMHLRAGAEKSA